MGIRRTSGPNLGAPLLEHLGRLLTDPSGLDEFRHWFSSALWDLESGAADAPDDITDLFYGIENLLGVYDAGYWSSEELVAAIRERVAEAGVDPEKPADWWTGPPKAVLIAAGPGRGGVAVVPYAFASRSPRP